MGKSYGHPLVDTSTFLQKVEGIDIKKKNSYWEQILGK